MLAELNIRNFAIIDELRIHFKQGLNVLTGETGAGKSIILDAMALVLGDRADTTMVRSGNDSAYVEAAFELNSDLQRAFSSLLEEQGLESDQNDLLLMSRELRINGRNICRVNGRAVNLALAKELGDRLVDIHGQGEHLSLLKPRSHLPLLDGYAELNDDRKALEVVVKSLYSNQRELHSLKRDEKALNQRVDLLKFQIEEIGSANLLEGEESELRAERTRQANSEQLLQFSNEAIAALIGLDDDSVTAIDLLGDAERAGAQLEKLDPDRLGLTNQVTGLTDQLNELAANLMAYRDGLDFEPARLEIVEERIELINLLKRKYGDDVAAILAHRAEAAAELEDITHSEERIKELEANEDNLLHQIGTMAFDLSKKRRLAKDRLAAAVERELNDLQMDRARFEVSLSYQEDENGAYVNERRFSFDATGIDNVEFLISANPGEPAKPLAKVASGGETSRLMLALKTVLAHADTTPTLIFDEIDQGIGGRVGNVVGRKLWGLTAPDSHQVIVVTHLPQLAGYADGHFHVSKRLSGDRTITTVVELDQKGRVNELAAMLGTQGEYATGGAESILVQVATAKTQG